MTRLILSAAVVLAMAGVCPAQWTTVNEGGPPFNPNVSSYDPATGFFGYTNYPSGATTGAVYTVVGTVTTVTPAVRNPDGSIDLVPVPTAKSGVSLSPDGVYAAGTASPGGVASFYKWNRLTNEVSYVPFAAVGYSPTGFTGVSAVAEDGAMVVSGQRVGEFWVYAGVVRPNGTGVQVPANRGYLAPQWQLSTAWVMTANGGGSYTARGTGSLNYGPPTNYALTGPLPN